MKRVFGFPAAIVIVLLFLLMLPDDAEDTVATPKLDPNAVIRFQFPDLPATFLAKQSANKTPAQISAQLPSNYTTTGKYPLFVFLEGGSGNAGDDLVKTRAIIGTEDFIAVSMPLFKVSEPGGKEPYISLDDYAQIGPAYTKMLQKLLDTVPNVDFSKGAICGFSNGGHSIADILIERDPFFMKLFHSFALVEGGTPFRDHPEAFATLRSSQIRLLFLVGEHPEEQAQVDAFKALLSASGLDVTVQPMKGVGHAFPQEYYPTVCAWVKEKPTVLP